MNEPSQMVLALAAGMLLGALFFGGLWWTVVKGASASRPVLWFGVSLLLRTGLAVAGFYFVSAGDWKRLLACLLGFLVARMVAMRLARTACLAEEGGHAP